MVDWGATFHAYVCSRPANISPLDRRGENPSVGAFYGAIFALPRFQGSPIVLQRRLGSRPNRATIEAIAAVGIGAMLLGVFSLGLREIGMLSGRALAGVFGVYVPAAFLIIRHVGTIHPFDHFGLPNGITLARLVLSSVVAGIALDFADQPMADLLAWVALAIAAVALMLDGLDGPLARARNLQSAFGARFDMEVDALLILLLALLAWLQAKAGAWVLLIGAARYAFVVAGWLWPALTRPLPPSFRRKAVCVVQGVSLATLMAPVIVPPASSVIAGAALVLIFYSFAVDVIWLIGHRHEA